MAKCKYWKKACCSISFLDKNYKKYYERSAICPKNTNNNCNIKHTPKLRRIKAWAAIVDGKIVDVVCSEDYECVTPCTILIDEKYLRK